MALPPTDSSIPPSSCSTNPTPNMALSTSIPISSANLPSTSPAAEALCSIPAPHAPSSPTCPSVLPSSSAPSPWAKKIASLQASIKSLTAQTEAVRQEIADVAGKLRTHPPSATVKAHITRLHDYNEIRDIGQGLLGMIADQRGVRIRDVYGEFGVSEGD